MKELLEEHCRWMETRNYAQGTLQNNRLYVGRFIDWLAERGVLRAQDVTRPMLERYQRVLFHHRKPERQRGILPGNTSGSSPSRDFSNGFAGNITSPPTRPPIWSCPRSRSVCPGKSSRHTKPNRF